MSALGLACVLQWGAAMRRWMAGVLVLGVSSVGACGGSTSSGTTGGSAGTGGSSAAGGSSASGGSAGTAGSAGTSPAGGAGGTAATGGSAGAGAQTSWDDCQHPGDCTLFAKNCCGSYCSEVPLDSWLPINSSMTAEVQAALCSNPVDCVDCVSYEDPNQVAACRQNKCVAVDIRTDALSACNTHADCELRWGSDCCESCGPQPTDLIAISKNASLENELCSPFAGACPPCVPPPYPSDAGASCIAGHCVVSWLGG